MQWRVCGFSAVALLILLFSSVSALFSWGSSSWPSCIRSLCAQDAFPGPKDGDKHDKARNMNTS